MYIYLNGQFVDEKHATVSVFDRGFLYGDGIFETMRAYSGYIMWTEQHLKRLLESAEMINLRVQPSKQDLSEVLTELMGRNELGDALIRLTLTRGVAPPGLNPGSNVRPTIVITTRQYQPYSSSQYADGVSLVIVGIRRNSIDALPPNIKSLNFLNNILAKAEATRKGAFDGIMLNQAGNLTEATTSNVFLVKNGKLFTPKCSCGILEGITRNAVIDLAEKQGVLCDQQPCAVEELYTADECFLTNTSMELMPVTRVDDRVIGTGNPGPMTARLHEAFRQAVEQHLQDIRSL